MQELVSDTEALSDTQPISEDAEEAELVKNHTLWGLLIPLREKRVAVELWQNIVQFALDPTRGALLTTPADSISV